MIHYNARPVKTLEALQKAVSGEPDMVEIATPSGFSPVYEGYLDRIPNGVTYFARQGNVSATFTKVGKHIVLNKTST